MLNPTVYFRNDSWNANTYYWTFGDNRMSTLFEPQHDYRAPGTYPVRLIATTNLGCKDTADREVIVGDTYTIYIPNSDILPKTNHSVSLSYTEEKIVVG